MFNKDTLDESIMKLYMELFYEDSNKDNKGIEFDLMDIGKKASKFRPEYSADMKITQKKSFTRTLCFV